MQQTQNAPEKVKDGIHVTHAVTINSPVEPLYAFWRDPTHLPQVMKHIESVEPLGDRHARWTITLPNDQTSTFEVEMIEDMPNERLSWRSLPDAEIQHRGTIHFRPAPAGRGTQVFLSVEFDPPGGALGQALLKLFDEAPKQYIGQYLRDFKQMIETGEKATTEGQTSGREDEVQQ
jgi:uncharacterized membrane protein